MIGVYPCSNKCGGSTRLPGVCEACALAALRAELHAALLPALRSIPPRFQWAFPGGDEAAERLKRERIREWTRVRSELMGAFEAGRNVVLLGPKPQVGKTSSACAVLRYVIERGTFDALPEGVRRELQGLGPALGPGEWPAYDRGRLPDAVRVARGARFVAVRDVRGESVEALDARRVAKAATVLVFDDVGDELDGAAAGVGVDSGSRFGDAGRRGLPAQEAGIADDLYDVATREGDGEVLRGRDGEAGLRARSGGAGWGFRGGMMGPDDADDVDPLLAAVGRAPVVPATEEEIALLEEVEEGPASWKRLLPGEGLTWGPS